VANKSRILSGGLLGAALALSLTACAGKHVNYLQEANGRATQEDVRKEMGEPKETRVLDDGTTQWIYRYEVRSSLIFRRGDMVGGSPCVDYALLFDSKNVLSYWTRQPCLVTEEAKPRARQVTTAPSDMPR
jgi:hypothetical protein